MKVRAFVAAGGLALTAGSIGYAQIEPQSRGPSPEQAAITAAPKNPSEAERLESFAAYGQQPQFLITFDRLAQENALRTALSRAGARPFRVFMFIDGMAGAHAVRPSEADLSVLENARAEVLAMVRAANERAEQDIAGLNQPNDELSEEALGRFARGALRRENQAEAMLNTFEAGRPIIYAVSVTAPADALGALRALPNVSDVRPGLAVSADRAVLPVPQLPEGRSTGLGADDHANLSDSEVLAKARARGVNK